MVRRTDINPDLLREAEALNVILREYITQKANAAGVEITGAYAHVLVVSSTMAKTIDLLCSKGYVSKDLAQAAQMLIAFEMLKPVMDKVTQRLTLKPLIDKS